ncbi:MAG: hypothetical protein Q7T56_16190 [Nocardioidaceae bacterium]|nr:hypothetical protein [Nocardioidaceae bacterium]
MAKKSEKTDKIDDKQLRSVTKDAVKAAVKSERKKLTKAVQAAEDAAERAEKAAAQATGRAKSAKKAKKAATKASKKAASRTSASDDHETVDVRDEQPRLEAETPAASVDPAESTESVVPEAAPLQNVAQDATLTEGSAKVAGDPIGAAPVSDAHVGLTRAQLIVLAGERGVPNRTRLTKAQLLEALQTS